MGTKTVMLCVVATALLAGCLGGTPETSEPTADRSNEPTTVEDGQTPWVRERVRALKETYNITPSGRRWLESYDLRQMVGQPGWFGSLGYKQWAGVGQAIPQSVIHEVGHSYWGAFPITGLERLSWDVPGNDGISPALQQYRDDLKTFMSQPPDSFEPLRERFRNMPNLSKGDYPDLFHHGEADLIHSVGGNLSLLPPILRKYFDQFLHEGEHSTWDEAIGWYLGLPTDDRKVADGYFGLTHFPIERYRDLRSGEPTKVSSKIKELLEREEIQRLIDFAQQFDLVKENELSLTDAASVDRGFHFWRDYLRDKLTLHKKFPEALASLGTRRAVQLKSALDTIVKGEELSEEEQVRFYRRRIDDDPSFMDFAVLLPSRVLVDLFGDADSEEEAGSVEGIVTRFSQKLKRYVKGVDDALEAGRERPEAGAGKLEGFLDNLHEDQRKADLGLIMDLLREADEDTALKVVNAMSDQAILRILREKSSAIMNGIIEPSRLLGTLNVQVQASQEEVVKGISLLLEHSSGNFKIDDPFTLLAYLVIADRGEKDHRDALDVLEQTKIPFLRFVTEHPKVARGILLSDPERTANLVAKVEGYRTTPQGIIHGIIFVDPELAARLVQSMANLGYEDPVVESLIVFAFDAHRLGENPSIKLSLEKDRLFLEHLIDFMGFGWLEDNMKRAVAKYQREVDQQRIDPNFIEEYRNTLGRILDRRTMPQIFGR